MPMRASNVHLCIQLLKSDLSALSDSIGHGLRQWTLSYIANRLDYLVVMIILNTYLLLSYCDTILIVVT
jgi:hypothetical protein